MKRNYIRFWFNDTIPRHQDYIICYKYCLFCIFCNSVLLFFSFCINSFLIADDDRTIIIRTLQDAWKERDVDTSEKLKNNFEYLWGKDDYIKKTGRIFTKRALGGIPVPPSKMDLFGDNRLAIRVQQFCQSKNWIYLNKGYHPSPEIVPQRFLLSQNPFLYDLLYWEWTADEIQFRKLETGNGMLLSIIPKNFNTKKGISDKELKNLLSTVTKIPFKEINKMEQTFPSILKEGTVFSNVDNLQELIDAKHLTIELQDKFPIPRTKEWGIESGEWSRQLVGFISKDAICLIIVHEVMTHQQPNSPLNIEGSSSWLSGRILKKSSNLPVLPRGLKESPESWKPILEENINEERLKVKQEDYNHLEEAKWRVWNGKDGKPLNNGAKMRFEYWYKPSVRPMEIPDNLPYKDGVVALKTRNKLGGRSDEYNKLFSLSQFSREDQKQITSVPPKKFQIAQLYSSGEVDAQGNIIQEKPKPIEPEPDDIE
ncbi:MAG: hypothetical protein LBP59_06695 [Planctomycetaceae bacterium]|jgi:hypothetical protein|nr:hypothetical protein [Planctomycetaceae bacterium]